MKKLQGIAKHYNENIGKKSDALMRNFAIFCCFQPKLYSQLLPSDSFMDHTTFSIYKTFFTCEISRLFWKNGIREIPDLTFSQLPIIS